MSANIILRDVVFSEQSSTQLYKKWTYFHFVFEQPIEDDFLIKTNFIFVRKSLMNSNDVLASGKLNTYMMSESMMAYISYKFQFGVSIRSKINGKDQRAHEWTVGDFRRKNGSHLSGAHWNTINSCCGHQIKPNLKWCISVIQTKLIKHSNDIYL